MDSDGTCEHSQVSPTTSDAATGQQDITNIRISLEVIASIVTFIESFQKKLSKYLIDHALVDTPSCASLY